MSGRSQSRDGGEGTTGDKPGMLAMLHLSSLLANRRSRVIVPKIYLQRAAIAASLLL